MVYWDTKVSHVDVFGADDDVVIKAHGGGGTDVTCLFDWIDAGSFHVPFAFLVDPLSVLMILVVTGVGFLIHVYSTSYMEHDEDFARYFTYLNLFTFAMLVLVRSKGNSRMIESRGPHCEQLMNG